MRRLVLRWFVLVGMLGLTAAAPPTDWMASQSAQCRTAIAAAETKYHLPPNLLGSIAKVESGRPIASLGQVQPWPWTIDADGEGLFLDSRAAAVAWARLGLKRGIQFMDVGCMQVDWQLHPGAFTSLDQAFDPMANADYAARYLRSLYDEAHGDWNVAVGMVSFAHDRPGGGLPVSGRGGGRRHSDRHRRPRTTVPARYPPGCRSHGIGRGQGPCDQRQSPAAPPTRQGDEPLPGRTRTRAAAVLTGEGLLTDGLRRRVDQIAGTTPGHDTRGEPCFQSHQDCSSPLPPRPRAPR